MFDFTNFVTHYVQCTEDYIPAACFVSGSGICSYFDDFWRHFEQTELAVGMDFDLQAACEGAAEAN